MQRGQQLDQAGQVEHVAQALAVGLEHDREVAVLLRDLEQRLRLQPLLPQRRALARARARDQQRAGGVLAEARAEQRRAGELGDDASSTSSGSISTRSAPGGSSASGRWTMIPSSDQIASDSSPSSSRIRALSASPQAAWTRPPNGRQHAQPPVADLVAEALDHDRAVGRDRRAWRPAARAGTRPGCSRRGGRGRSRARAPPACCSTAQRENAPIASPSSFGRPTPSPFQNGTAPGRPGRRRDDHAVAADLLDPPRGRAEQERLPGARLVDHLLVELADAAAVGQRDRVQAAVGDRAGVGDRELAGARAARGSCRRPGPRRSAGAARRTPSDG